MTRQTRDELVELLGTIRTERDRLSSELRNSRNECHGLAGEVKRLERQREWDRETIARLQGYVDRVRESEGAEPFRPLEKQTPGAMGADTSLAEQRSRW